MWNQFHLITIMIQNQVVHRTNQSHHLIKNPHYQLKTLMTMKNHPLKNHILDHGPQKKEVNNTIKKLKRTKNTLYNSGIKFIHNDI